MLRPLDLRCERIQFDQELSEADHEKLAAFLTQYPKVGLRDYDFNRAEVSYLRFYSSLKNYQLDCFSLQDLSGVDYLPDTLECFGFGATRTKRFSLRFLDRFKNLRELYNDGHHKDIEVLGELAQLRKLSLSSISRDNFDDILNKLRHLEILYVSLGGTKDLRAVAKNTNLQILKLVMIRGFSDIEFISSMHSLQFLFLDSLKHITALPDFSHLNLLRRLQLHNMKGIDDLSPILEATNLEELAIFFSRHLKPKHFQCLLAHKNLKRISVATDGIWANKKILSMFNLPSAGLVGDIFN